MGEIIKYGKVWGTNESTLNKTADTGSDGVTIIGTGSIGQHRIRVLYDNYDGDNEIPYENFTLDIIDTNTGEYPTWLIHYFHLTNIVTPLGSALKNAYPDNTPPRYSINEWRFVCGWNWLQDADTQPRSMEITFTESETGESVTHTLTQEGALAANKTPLNLTMGFGSKRPSVTGGTGTVVVRFDATDTFVGVGNPGEYRVGVGYTYPGKWYNGFRYSQLYTDGIKYDPVWDVEIIDVSTGEPATWATFIEVSNIELVDARNNIMSATFVIDFEDNTGGVDRQVDVNITELNHNESIVINTGQSNR